MEMLSEDDLNLKDMTDEELGRAWDLWFTLAQATNDFDPPWTHGVFVLSHLDPEPSLPAEAQDDRGEPGAADSSGLLLPKVNSPR